jgi:glycosyltransferase involved in cell wall biosynthesis
MQILFVHSTFPGQFGPVLDAVSRKPGVECVFVTKAAATPPPGVRCIRFEPRGGATSSTHYCSRTFENQMWHAHAVYEACKRDKELHPDLIVGHSGFGSTLFLPDLYSCPIINLFEYYYRGSNSDLDFRTAPPELHVLRSRSRNAMILLDLQNCSAGYTPTDWQSKLFPANWQAKLRTIHDGIDTVFWRRKPLPRTLRGEAIDANTRIVTYVARGLESMRGFDVFVRTAKRILAEFSDALFVVVGGDGVHYGNDNSLIRASSFREHVLAEERPDLSRFRFLGTISKDELADVFSLSDLHIYLTVPFVLSWSLLNAMACECVIVGSNTAPVTEVLRHEENALLADFFDADALALQALRVLKATDDYGQLARRARTTIEERYSVDVVLPKMWQFYQSVIAKDQNRVGA